MLDFAPNMTSRNRRYLDLISGRRRGLASDLARGALSLPAAGYRFVIGVRNAYYSTLKSTRRGVNRPVISIGNLTTGGTGKTPLAVFVANHCQSRNVAILTRGYKGRTLQFDSEQRDEAAAKWRAESDEAMVLKRRCPQARVIIDPDRLRGAARAIAEGADVLILDDGFQHRRLARDLDIVLVDATLPFGYGKLLPRGLLREPPNSLRRADVIVLTRSDQVETSTRALLVAQLKRLGGDRPVLPARHRISGFLDLKGRSVAIADAEAMRAVIFAGIANFESFRRGVEDLGVHILAAYEYPDHHPYTPEEIAGLADVAVEMEANVVLTTEKDAVKLVGRWSDEPCRLLVLDLEIEFSGDGGKILGDAVDAVLADR